MTDRPPALAVAEPPSDYQLPAPIDRWVEVLVDRPGRAGVTEESRLFTYRVPIDLPLQAGDIVSVPFGSQLLGGIVIRFVQTLPEGVTVDRVREVEEVIATGFSPIATGNSSNGWRIITRRI